MQAVHRTASLGPPPVVLLSKFAQTGGIRLKTAGITRIGASRASAADVHVRSSEQLHDVTGNSRVASYYTITVHHTQNGGT